MNQRQKNLLKRLNAYMGMDGRYRVSWQSAFGFDMEMVRHEKILKRMYAEWLEDTADDLRRKAEELKPNKKK